MPTIKLTTSIDATPDRVFDLARSIEVHVASTARTRERAVAGRTAGLAEMNDEITWEATHFGVKQRLTVRITAFDRPRLFTDQMISGAFASMSHVHRFDPIDSGTLMTDELTYRAPLGVLGRFAERLFLTRYMRQFLVDRNQHLKHIAECHDEVTDCA